MENVIKFKELIESAKQNVDAIFSQVELAKGTTNYPSYYLNEKGGYTASTIQQNHYLPHGDYIDFGTCQTKQDVIERIDREESEMDQLISQGLGEYVGR